MRVSILRSKNFVFCTNTNTFFVNQETLKYYKQRNQPKFNTVITMISVVHVHFCSSMVIKYTLMAYYNLQGVRFSELLILIIWWLNDLLLLNNDTNIHSSKANTHDTNILNPASSDTKFPIVVLGDPFEIG